MSKYIFFIFLSFSCLFSIDIPRLDLAVDIEGGNAYKFYKNASPVAVVRVPISVGEQLGDYQVEVGNLSGSFSCGSDQISYSPLRNPRFDVVNNNFPIHFDKKDSIKELPLLLQLPAEKILAPGTYVAEVPITIKQDEEVVLERTVTAYFYVEEQMEARVYLDGEEKFDDTISVAFGEVVGETEKELILSVRANTDVKISISSYNNGRLILDGEEDRYSPYYIPYTLKYKGEEISLVTKTTLMTKTFKPGQGEMVSTFTLLVTPNLKKNFSGKYKDRICVTITPTL